jgi:hypothetical protein
MVTYLNRDHGSISKLITASVNLCPRYFEPNSENIAYILPIAIPRIRPLRKNHSYWLLLDRRLKISRISGARITD